MPTSARRYKGKLKRQIADEELGPKATVPQVDAYFRKHYNLSHCERSMFAAAKRRAEGKPQALPRRYRRYKEQIDVVDVIVRLTQLAHDVGGWEKVEDLICVMKGTAT
jgi:hypothetical protein